MITSSDSEWTHRCLTFLQIQYFYLKSCLLKVWGVSLNGFAWTKNSSYLCIVKTSKVGFFIHRLLVNLLAELNFK